MSAYRVHNCVCNTIVGNKLPNDFGNYILEAIYINKQYFSRKANSFKQMIFKASDLQHLI